MLTKSNKTSMCLVLCASVIAALGLIRTIGATCTCPPSSQCDCECSNLKVWAWHCGLQEGWYYSHAMCNGDNDAVKSGVASPCSSSSVGYDIHLYDASVVCRCACTVGGNSATEAWNEYDVEYFASIRTRWLCDGEPQGPPGGSG